MVSNHIARDRIITEEEVKEQEQKDDQDDAGFFFWGISSEEYTLLNQPLHLTVEVPPVDPESFITSIQTRSDQDSDGRPYCVDNQ